MTRWDGFKSTPQLEAYEAAWKQLSDLVRARNDRLDELKQLTAPAADLTLATGMYYQFDTGRARAILQEIDRLTPAILAGIEQVNDLAGAIGRPKIAIHEHGASA